MFETIFVISVLIEAVVETVARAIEAGFNWKMITAFVLGGFFAYFFGVDLLAAIELVPAVAGMPVVAVNVLLSGVLFARYSGAANDLLEYLKGLRP